MRSARRIAGLVLFAVCGIASACAKDPPNCYTNEYLGCYCADGGLGYQSCAPSQDGYGACVCDGTTPGLDSGPVREAGPGDGSGRKDATVDADAGDGDGGDGGDADATDGGDE